MSAKGHSHRSSCPAVMPHPVINAARRVVLLAMGLMLSLSREAAAQRYMDANGQLRVSLSQQPLLPDGRSNGPRTMATGGIREQLTRMGASVRVAESALTATEDTEYGGWKRLGMSLGHFADIVSQNERDGVFTVGLLATCPSMLGMVAGLQHSGATAAPLTVGMLWLDAHPDFNTPETTRSGSLGGMPVAVATGRALQRLRRDAKLDPRCGTTRWSWAACASRTRWSRSCWTRRTSSN